VAISVAVALRIANLAIRRPGKILAAEETHSVQSIAVDRSGHRARRA
jgi:hypothetical protein